MQPSPADLDPLLTEREQQLAEFQEQLEGQEEDQPAQDSPTQQPTQQPTAPDRADEAGGGGAGDDGLPWLAIVAVLLLATTAFVLVVAWQRRHDLDHGLDGTARVLAAQRRLHATARSLGVGRRPSETAAEVTQRWVAEGRVDPDVAGRFALLAQAAAFGGELSETAGAEADALATRLTTSLRASVQSRDRVLAPVRVPVETAAAAGRDVVARVRSELEG